ncbi:MULTISPECIES: SURF1 family protein [unclassified Nocardioides]|uniref:SURF1 family cytochrome oxidase biogenesis protein n=1 Tax=unclassified Nocardioides TaxID=2615069 RepID=UPI00129640E3|nr:MULTISPECIES: SURF1 family protein [unclassified Nocardioides]
MRSLSFLFTRRWILFLLAIIVLGAGTWWLGEWQFNQLEKRRAANEVVRTNEMLTPTPVEEVLSPGEEIDSGDEWRLVEATGRYLPEDTVLVRYASSPSGAEGSGVDVVVPFRTDDGTVLLVNRGWQMRADVSGTIGEIPEPPSGELTVTGWVRPDGDGSSTEVVDGSARAISSEAISEAEDLGTTYGGWIELRDEDGRTAEPLEAAQLPTLDDGPHFFYGLQWWFFGVLGAGGFLYLAYDEWRGGPARRQERQGDKPPSKADIRRARRAAAKQAEREARQGGSRTQRESADSRR